jgi:hypothetical protein
MKITGLLLGVLFLAGCPDNDSVNSLSQHVSQNVTSVPEPSTLLLLTIGIAVVGAIYFWKR